MSSSVQQLIEDMAQFPEMNPGPVVRIITDGTVVLANRAARSFFSDDGLVGGSWLAICPGVTPELWHTILSTRDNTVHEADFGDTCILFTHVRSRTDDSTFAYGADVTQLRLAERSLSEVARFPEMNPGPVLRMSQDGVILLANAAARRVIGENVIGRNWLEVCPFVSSEFWQRAIQAETPIPIEAVLNDCVFVFSHRADPTSKLVFVFGMDITQQKMAEKALRQTEKMATLGTLAAGVAHELNNPAAAATRAAEQLRDAFSKFERSLLALDLSHLTPVQLHLREHLESKLKQCAAKPNDLDPLSRSDLESEIEEWLDEKNFENSWEIAPSLVAQGLTPAELHQLTHTFQGGILMSIVQWAADAFPVYRLLYEISQGSQRISEIVAAMKGYSYVGQAPIRMIDIHEGLDNTLVILRNKLKTGITVHRDYDDSIPLICAFGSELNQVWTNLIDNAADAVAGRLQGDGATQRQGEISIVTKREGDWVVVEISDNGPGIPAEIVSRIFDPFFTTKAPGKGTGLGLSTTYSIIKDKHKGEIDVVSQPGRSTFTVRLLIDNPDLMYDRKDDYDG